MDLLSNKLMWDKVRYFSLRDFILINNLKEIKELLCEKDNSKFLFYYSMFFLFIEKNEGKIFLNSQRRTFALRTQKNLLLFIKECVVEGKSFNTV